MRELVYHRTGQPDVLHLEEHPPPEPGVGEVAVRIHRSGVNPTDWKSRQGSEPGQPVDPPQIPGQDGAGVIVAVGAGVDPGRVGERVWLWLAAYQRPYGTAAEQTVVPAERAVTLPDGASFDLGASLGVPFVTAHRCLTVREGGPTQLAPGALAGCSVLVAGGAGAVGNAAIQLAVWAGASVLTTVSSAEKRALATAAGAQHVINYREQDVSAEVRRVLPDGVDIIVEVSPTANTELDTAVLAPHGAVAFYANNGGDTFTVPVRPLMVLNARWQAVLLYTAPPAALAHAIAGVSAAVAAGAVRVGDDAGLPLHHFPLERGAAAHHAVEDGVVGKVLIDVSD